MTTGEAILSGLLVCSIIGAFASFLKKKLDQRGRFSAVIYKAGNDSISEKSL